MVKMIIWIAIGLLALSFFGISLRGLYESPTNQDNLSFLITLLNQGWTLIVHWFQTLPDFFKNIGHFSVPTATNK
jgi:hypothetical protein